MRGSCQQPTTCKLSPMQEERLATNWQLVFNAKQSERNRENGVTKDRKKKLSLTIHLSLIGENDLSSTTRRIDCERFLESLFNIGRPYAFSVRASTAAV